MIIFVTEHACKDFRCTTKEFCIDTDLVCDGIRHCEDGSDEAASTLCASKFSKDYLSKIL